MPRCAAETLVALALALGFASPSRGADAPSPAPPREAAEGAPASPAWAPAWPSDDAPLPPAWAAIAEVEHRRGAPGALDPFLDPSSQPATRARALVALGRLGAREGVVPRLRRLLREEGGSLPAALWAAGAVGDRSLVPETVASIDAAGPDRPEVLAAALGALGQLGDVRAEGWATALLASKSPVVRSAALDALARMGAEGRLEQVARLVETELALRRSAACAAWRLSAARRRARAAPGAVGPQSEALGGWRQRGVAGVFGERFRAEDDPVVRLFLLRAVNALLPETVERQRFKVVVREDGAPPWEAANPPEPVLLDAVADLDPVLAADAVRRLAGLHKGPEVVLAVGRALAHPHPLVRTAAAAAAPADAKDAIASALAAEKDPRVREALFVAAARCGIDGAADALAARDDRPDDPLLRARTEVAVALAAADESAQARVEALLARADLPPSAILALLEGLADRERPRASDGAGRDPLASRVRALAGHADPRVRAGVAAYAAKRLGVAALPELRAALAASAARPDPRAERDLRQACAEALGEVAQVLTASPAGDPRASPTPADAVRDILEPLLSDEAPTVRAAARAAARRVPALAARAAAEDPTPNDWRGLPRPKAPVLGLDLTQGGPWLDEAEILRLAREIDRQGARLVLETTQGDLHFALDAVWAPVHCANALLCALAGVWDRTPWHRVEPGFVVQGGDPQGDGTGDAGWTLPDEISPIPFERGVLGAPKSTKDTAGCQVFVVLAGAPHLDGGYTAYGRLKDGFDALDRLQVGDRILRARIDTRGRRRP